LKKLSTYFFDAHHQFSESKVFRKLLAFYVIYKCVYWIYDYKLLFTPESIVYKNDVAITFWQMPAFLLFKSNSVSLPISFLAILIIAALIIFFTNKKLRVWTFLIWFGITNLNYAVYPTLSAGDYVLQNLLFFAIFLSDGEKKSTEFKTGLDRAVHNTGVIALQVQVCIIYFYAAYAKLFDQDWIAGKAVNFIFSIHDYSLPCLYESNSVTGQVLNYLVIWYQLLFPVLVWYRPIKKWYLLAGILQHLLIAFVIGLPSFGFIMIIAYAIFYVPGVKTQKTS